MQAERFTRLHLMVSSLLTAAAAAVAKPWTVSGTILDENNKPV